MSQRAQSRSLKKKLRCCAVTVTLLLPVAQSGLNKWPFPKMRFREDWVKHRECGVLTEPSCFRICWLTLWCYFLSKNTCLYCVRNTGHKGKRCRREENTFQSCVDIFVFEECVTVKTPPPPPHKIVKLHCPSIACDVCFKSYCCQDFLYISLSEFLLFAFWLFYALSSFPSLLFLYPCATSVLCH